jgi:hypothetical protein
MLGIDIHVLSTRVVGCVGGWVLIFVKGRSHGLCMWVSAFDLPHNSLIYMHTHTYTHIYTYNCAYHVKTDKYALGPAHQLVRLLHQPAHLLLHLLGRVVSWGELRREEYVCRVVLCAHVWWGTR